MTCFPGGHLTQITWMTKHKRALKGRLWRRRWGGGDGGGGGGRGVDGGGGGKASRYRRLSGMEERKGTGKWF